MEGFVAKDQQFVAKWLAREGLEKLVDVFKGMFSDVMHLFRNWSYHCCKKKTLNGKIGNDQSEYVFRIQDVCLIRPFNIVLQLEIANQKMNLRAFIF